MGGLTFARGLILIVTASCMLAVSTADKNHKIIVGGSEGWKFNFSYTSWAEKNGPFYADDTLVFKYDAPVDNNSIPHNVFLLRNHESFEKCDLKGAKLLADEKQGGGDGFEFVLKKCKPHYFACGVHEGAHCNFGKMKFFVEPLHRPS
ncbi:blue copper protein 1b-like [Corylus avellana]|uniref:blue copper protein 1b-like n=1 Tax=Corylus avellana TaxID=13451 RepID=UPI001E21911A|nr:blue copper protein 1b-like [Corylus avellana]